MAQYVPPDWPAGVHPPGSEGWEATAVTWLLDLVPEYRQYTMVCRHPVILASIARHLIHGSADGARDGYRTVRTELAEHPRRTPLTPRSRPIALRDAAWRPPHAPWIWWNALCAARCLNLGSDCPLTRSFRSWWSTAALLVRAGFLVFWLPLDVPGFRSVPVRGRHDQLGRLGQRAVPGAAR